MPTGELVIGLTNNTNDYDCLSNIPTMVERVPQAPHADAQLLWPVSRLSRQWAKGSPQASHADAQSPLFASRMTCQCPAAPHADAQLQLLPSGQRTNRPLRNKAIQSASQGPHAERHWIGTKPLDKCGFTRQNQIQPLAYVQSMYLRRSCT